MEEPLKKADNTLKNYKKSIAFRSISGIVALLVIFAGIMGYIGYDGFHDSTLEQYEEGALLTAQTAADIIDGEDLYRYVQSKPVFDYSGNSFPKRLFCFKVPSKMSDVISSDEEPS